MNTTRKRLMISQQQNGPRRSLSGRGWVCLVTVAIGALLGAVLPAIRVGAASQSMRYDYDKAGRLVTAVYDKTAAIQYQYDASGNRTRETGVGPGNPRADYDGNQLYDLYECIYFGFIGADPAGDPDGDSFSNYQESKCWTDPLDALSKLQLLGLSAVADATNKCFILTWPSAQYATYAIDHSTNLLGSGAFTPLTNGLVATPPLNTFTARVEAVGTAFFRIGVQ